MKNILLIATGGTIASRPTADGLLPQLLAGDILRCVPSLAGLCHVDALQLMNLDSTNITPDCWLAIARCIREHYDDYDGFVLTHGTDTMAYTAAALSYLIQSSAKPIVLTGAQKSIYSEDTDARRNLFDAFLAAQDDALFGVLLVFERETPLDEYFKTGTLVDAQLSEQLLRNLFFKNSPLHDGAVIVRGGRIAAAGCVMPLSDNPHLPSDLGTRHRAGVGTSEASDAVVVIVSEENGTISVAIGGMLKRHLAPQTLQKLLTNELIADGEEKQSLLRRLAAHFGRKDGPNEK